MSARSIEEVFREERVRVLATLVRMVGDLDLAEDSVQEAYLGALKQWPVQGWPDNPRAWLLSAARFRAIDAIRKRERQAIAYEDLAGSMASWDDEPIDEVADDRLRLIFLCCHPALPHEGAIALTLREVCGLSTEEIARAFLISTPTAAQRIVRAKSRIRDERLPFELPGPSELEARVEAALRVAYLVFNEGYYASSGYSLVRPSLASEGIRLARLLAELSAHPEATGLLALMLLQESRRAARTTGEGDIVLLPDQDRSRWDQGLIREALALLQSSSGFEPGTYALQAQIAAVHATAPNPGETDWRRIVMLYDKLLQRSPSPVVELNRAVALAMSEGPEAGHKEIERLLSRGDLGRYGLAYSAKADLCLRLGRYEEALAAFRRALALAEQEPERRFLTRKVQEAEEKARRSCRNGGPSDDSPSDVPTVDVPEKNP